ncbi:MAG: class I SAM-dependent methyltransferase [Bryobacteraceae bacterium]|nr:class I SAM-dependent methyltransferase [Bryobacteraceae bacterium]
MRYTTAAYDPLAGIYDAWIASAGPELNAIRDFYAARYLAAAGPVVELGVGNGRILIEAALAGKHVIGVDESSAMLELCRRHAAAAGVQDRVHLQRAGFSNFHLARPADLIAVPYDSIGHLLTAAERGHFVKHAFEQLAPGGKLILDQALHDPEAARPLEGQPHFRTSYFDESTGEETLLWFTPHQDVARRRRSAVIYSTGAGGLGPARVLGTVENSWFRDATEVQDLLTGGGFQIEDTFGDFAGGPLRSDSEYQIWIASRPGPRQ